MAVDLMREEKVGTGGSVGGEGVAIKAQQAPVVLADVPQSSIASSRSRLPGHWAEELHCASISAAYLMGAQLSKPRAIDQYTKA